MDFIERVSTLLGKQYLFKQENGLYYNKYTGDYNNTEEAEDFLIKELSEIIV